MQDRRPRSRWRPRSMPARMRAHAASTQQLALRERPASTAAMVPRATSTAPTMGRTTSKRARRPQEGAAARGRGRRPAPRCAQRPRQTRARRALGTRATARADARAASRARACRSQACTARSTRAAEWIAGTAACCADYGARGMACVLRTLDLHTGPAPITDTHAAWLHLSASDEQGACPRLLALFFLYQPNLKDYCGA